jgi:hypothetical protein
MVPPKQGSRPRLWSEISSYYQPWGRQCGKAATHTPGGCLDIARSRRAATQDHARGTPRQCQEQTPASQERRTMSDCGARHERGQQGPSQAQLGQIRPGLPPEPRRRAAARRTPRRGRQPRQGCAEERRCRSPRGPRSGQDGLRSGPHRPELRTSCVAATSTPARPSRRLHRRDASGRRRDDPPPRSSQDCRETLDPAAPFTGVGRHKFILLAIPYW